MWGKLRSMAAEGSIPQWMIAVGRAQSNNGCRRQHTSDVEPSVKPPTAL